MEVLKPDYPDSLYPLKELGKELSYEVARLKSICKAQKIEVTSDSGVTYIPIGAKQILENIKQLPLLDLPDISSSDEKLINPSLWKKKSK